MKYQKEKNVKDSKSFCIGPLTYQTWNKNIKRNPNTEDRRNVLQLKWGSLETDLIKITSYREYYKQNGTYEGDLDEKSSVIYFNRNPDDNTFKKYFVYKRNGNKVTVYNMDDLGDSFVVDLERESKDFRYMGKLSHIDFMSYDIQVKNFSKKDEEKKLVL